MSAALLGVFWAMQVIANLFFKYGSAGEGRWLPGFVLGNVFGASSIWFMMKLYARMNPNLALALAGGGAFVCVQLALALGFHSRPTPVQWVGFAAVGAGMAVALLASPESKG